MSDPTCSLNIRKIQWGPDHTSVYCDSTGEALRPIIPSSLRKRVFHLFHNQVHPSAKVTDRVIRKRYVWPSIRRDISDWCKACPECQQSKISRHNRLLPTSFPPRMGAFAMCTWTLSVHSPLVMVLGIALRSSTVFRVGLRLYHLKTSKH